MREVRVNELREGVRELESKVRKKVLSLEVKLKVNKDGTKKERFS